MKYKFTIRYTIAGVIFGLLFPIFSTIGELFVQNLSFSIPNILEIQNNSILLQVIDTAPFFLGLFASIAGRGQDKLRNLNIDLENQIVRRNEAIVELHRLKQNLENQVEQRTASLQRRSIDLQAAAEVGQRASSVLKIDQLINQVTEVIRERFGLYYVGLFLVDETRDWADLRAGTGAAGRAMLARGHRIRIGQGMIGWCIANGQPRVTREAADDTVRLATAELPDTHSEAAIPLRVRGEVIGAITVQDVLPDAFDESRIAVLQTMAGQVGIAIENARLFSESQETLETLRRVYGEARSKDWQNRNHTVFSCQNTNLGTTENNPQAFETGQQTNAEKSNSLKIPIKIRDQAVGELITGKKGEDVNWHPDEISLIQTVVDQLGIALESASLYEETQRRASFEVLTREVTTRIRETLDLESVLQTAASEFRRVLDLSEVEIRMGLSDGIEH